MSRLFWRGFLVLGSLVVLGLGVGLFVLQNSARATQLSIDLWFVAFQLSEPVSIPLLMGLSALVGFLLGVLVVLPKRWSSDTQDLGLPKDDPASASWT